MYSELDKPRSEEKICSKCLFVKQKRCFTFYPSYECYSDICNRCISGHTSSFTGYKPLMKKGVNKLEIDDARKEKAGPFIEQLIAERQLNQSSCRGRHV